VDLRVLNPFDSRAVVESVRKTRRLLVIDGGWRSCGMSAEVIASCAESLPPGTLAAAPVRVTLPDAPAPTSRALERFYYPDVDLVVARSRQLVSG
jgi:pyruvate dehydrogenase E1 component beta subunit